MKGEHYVLVDATMLPDVYLRVLDAKHLLKSGKASSVGEAVQKAKISRSAYYKYKDFVFPFYEANRKQILTLYVLLEDQPGVLSNFIDAVAKAGANILTINQNIPSNGVANITVSMEIGELKSSVEQLLKKIRSKTGILKVGFVAQD